MIELNNHTIDNVVQTELNAKTIIEMDANNDDTESSIIVCDNVNEQDQFDLSRQSSQQTRLTNNIRTSERKLTTTQANVKTMNSNVDCAMLVKRQSKGRGDEQTRGSETETSAMCGQRDCGRRFRLKANLKPHTKIA